MESTLERKFRTLLELHAIDAWVQEYKFHPTRRWRFDFAWPKYKIAVELQGGVYLRRRSGHSSRSGIQADIDKGNAATVLGWSVLQFTTVDLRKKPVHCVELLQGLIEEAKKGET